MGGVLLLAGDTCEARFVEKSKDLRRICRSFDKVYAIAGNHEYYHGDIYMSEDHIRVDTLDIENFNFLQKEAVKLSDEVTLIAATLWTNFNKGDIVAKVKAEFGLNDYRLIRNGSTTYSMVERLTASDIEAINKDHFNFIQDEVKKANKCIIMTHHAPIMNHINPEYVRHGDVNYAYASDYSEFILDNTDKIAVWAHGHTHDKRETLVGNTRVITNARGYVPSAFEARKIINV